MINNKDKKSIALLDELRKKGEPLKQNSTNKSQGSNSKTTKKPPVKTKDPKEVGMVAAKKGVDQWETNVFAVEFEIISKICKLNYYMEVLVMAREFKELKDF